VTATLGTRPETTATTTAADTRTEYDRTLRIMSEASVERHFEAFKDIAWDDPAMSVDVPDDERWILSTIDPIGRTSWYRSLPRERQIAIGRHRYAAVTKTGSQFEQLLLLGGTQFLMGRSNQNPEFRYFMHELTEECHHIQMFQEFTNRVCPEVSGVPRWLLHLFPVVGHIGGLAPAAFFSIILAGEEPIDHVQKDLMRAGGVHPLLDRVMSIHIAEEARHIGFAHEWLREHGPHLGPVSRFLVALGTPAFMRIGSDAIILPSRRDRKAMGIPRSAWREAWKTEAYKKTRRDLFSDVRMLFDELGMRGPAYRWLWRLLGVDGRPARYRAEPAAASH
jgi:hypothetical protein